ncbi:DNA-binding protein [Achromobacter xylosoxidans]|nr:DNA-binding protein [Achromobacter xylosoxidans]
MNPFVHSTVARHLPLAPWRRARPAAMPACPRAGQRALRQALGALLLSAGLGVAAPPAQAVDINQATAAQLEGLRGIGPRTAEIIVRERERGGRFESLDDLTERVRGIGQKKAQALQAAGMTIGAAGAAPRSAAGAAPAVRPAPGKAAAAKPAGSSTAGGAAAAGALAPARAKP